MAKTLIIDGNSIGYASHHGTKLNAGGMQTQAVFGFVKSMRELRSLYPEHTPMVLWDGRAEWRFDLLPSYKSNRSNDPKKLADKEAYKEQGPYIRRALTHLGVRQMTVGTHEADDMAGFMVSSMSRNPENDIVLISGDQDWLQLVRNNVSWRDMRDDAKIINSKNFYDKTGYKTPFAFLEGKCLQGDASDVIPGVGGIGEKGAPEFLAQFGSIKEFWRQVDSGEYVPTKKAWINLASKEGRQAFLRNLKVMQLIKVAKPEKDKVSVEAGALDKEKFAEICEELAFGSILKNLDSFLSVF